MAVTPKPNTGLLERWNKANLLTEDALNKGWGLKTQLAKKVGKPKTVGELVDNIALLIFGTMLPALARDTFIEFAADGGGASTPVTPDLMSQKLGTLFGLILASPLNQWR